MPETKRREKEEVPAAVPDDGRRADGFAGDASPAAGGRGERPRGADVRPPGRDVWPAGFAGGEPASAGGGPVDGPGVPVPIGAGGTRADGFEEGFSPAAPGRSEPDGHAAGAGEGTFTAGREPGELNGSPTTVRAGEPEAEEFGEARGRAAVPGANGTAGTAAVDKAADAEGDGAPDDAGDETAPPAIDLARWREKVRRARLLRPTGRVRRVIGLTVEVGGITARIGEVCRIAVPGEDPVPAEVVGFREGVTLLMPLGELRGVYPGCLVVPEGRGLRVPVGEALLGRVLDGLARPLDGGPPPDARTFYPVDNPPPNPLARRRISEILATGVRAIDACLTCGRGQRLGIFAGSGVGKSTLLGMIARYSAADVNVIALVGERGREVRDFIEGDLGPDGLARSVVVAATSDRPALERLKAAFVASAVAEYFRDRGRDVLLLMDSVTRFAMAQREVGLAIGEPPATRGYTPSVFALLPRLLERSGMGPCGSITAFYTVLVEGDDMNEPIADAVRGILDGHIVLSRRLAAQNHYPAIDLLQSVSRLMPEIADAEHLARAGRLRDLLAAYRQSEDLINIGAYVAGTSAQVDAAVAAYDGIIRFLRQDMREASSLEKTLAGLAATGA